MGFFKRNLLYIVIIFTTQFGSHHPPASPAGEEDELKDSEALDHFSEVCSHSKFEMYHTIQICHTIQNLLRNLTKFTHNLVILGMIKCGAKRFRGTRPLLAGTALE